MLHLVAFSSCHQCLAVFSTADNPTISRIVVDSCLHDMFERTRCLLCQSIQDIQCSRFAGAEVWRSHVNCRIVLARVTSTYRKQSCDNISPCSNITSINRSATRFKPSELIVAVQGRRMLAHFVKMQRTRRIPCCYFPITMPLTTFLGLRVVSN